MMPRRNSPNTRFRPRNRRRDSAYAAMVPKNTVSTTVTTDVMKLAMNQFHWSPEESSVAYEASVRCQSFRMGPAPREEVAFDVSDVLIAHRLGMSHSTANTRRTTQETMANIRPERALLDSTRAGAAAETPVRSLRRVSVPVSTGVLTP